MQEFIRLHLRAIMFLTLSPPLPPSWISLRGTLPWWGVGGGRGFGRWARPRGENGGSTNHQRTRPLLSLSTKFCRQRTRSKTIKLISLLCMLHRKKTQTIKPFFHLNSQKISLAFSFLTIPQNQPINLFIIKYYNHFLPLLTSSKSAWLKQDHWTYHFLPVCF